MACTNTTLFLVNQMLVFSCIGITLDLLTKTASTVVGAATSHAELDVASLLRDAASRQERTAVSDQNIRYRAQLKTPISFRSFVGTASKACSDADLG
jgi:hypothetical protein